MPAYENELSIAFIGGAIWRRPSDSWRSAKSIHVIDITIRGLAGAWHDHRGGPGRSALAWCRVCAFAVKPQNMKDAVGVSRVSGCKDDTQVSVAAGIRATSLAGWPDLRRAVRAPGALPNTPALVGAGVTSLSLDGVSEADRALAVLLLESVEAVGVGGGRRRAGWRDDCPWAAPGVCIPVS